MHLARTQIKSMLDCLRPVPCRPEERSSSISSRGMFAIEFLHELPAGFSSFLGSVKRCKVPARVLIYRPGEIHEFHD